MIDSRYFEKNQRTDSLKSNQSFISIEKDTNHSSIISSFLKPRSEGPIITLRPFVRSYSPEPLEVALIFCFSEVRHCEKCPNTELFLVLIFPCLDTFHAVRVPSNLKKRRFGLFEKYVVLGLLR